MAGNIGGYVQPQGGGGGGAAGSSPQTVTTSYLTTELVSGGKAVSFSQSGTLRVAMASVSGRMPAIGVVRDNVTSGLAANVYQQGALFNVSSGTPWDFSGWPGQVAYVGRSGDVVGSGAPSSSGDVVQVLGQIISQSGLMVQIGEPLQLGVISSGDVGSGAITGAAGGFFTIASGSIGTNDMGSGSVQSGQLSSGVIGPFHLASGAVTSGRILSGNVSTYDLASGCTVARSQFVSPVYSGTPWSMNTGEVISGVRGVCVSQSGYIIQAMAAVSGRGPAVGVVIDNVVSGLPCNIYTHGLLFFTSGLFTSIGFGGQPVWLGRSGHLVPLSGSFGSGGFASGDEGQKMGVCVMQSGSASFGSGAVLLNVNTTIWSGGPLGEATGGGIL